MNIGLSTVVDAHPRFWCEFMLWTLCAKAHTKAPMRAYFVGTPPPGLVRFAGSQGVDIRYSETLLPASPHCNKLLPFLDPDGFADQIVTDTDIFMLADLAALMQPDAVRLAPNYHCNPPLPFFQDLFRARGLGPPEPGLALFVGGAGLRETYLGNVNSGVIMIPRAHRDFAQAWLERARWMLDNPGLIGRWVIHTDQISFSLAARETGVPFVFLPPQANAMLEVLPQIQSLIALHLTSAHVPKYPDWFAADKSLRIAEINPALEPELSAFNGLIAQATTAINAVPELSAFAENFINPAWRR